MSQILKGVPLRIIRVLFLCCIACVSGGSDNTSAEGAVLGGGREEKVYRNEKESHQVPSRHIAESSSDHRAHPVAGQCWLSPDHASYLIAFEDPLEAFRSNRICNVYLGRSSGSLTWVYGYQRGISVIWSPLSDKFLINDAYASDASNCLAFAVSDGKVLSDVETILRSDPDKGYTDVVTSDKCYIRATGWKSDEEITLNVSGWRWEEERKSNSEFSFQAELDVSTGHLVITKPMSKE
jgi:hypothetical protein